MGEYEPNDSRNVTLSNDNAPGEPPRTGPREEKTRYETEEQAARRASELAAKADSPHFQGQGEQGARAAPQPGAPGRPGDPQATQSQWQGQSQAGEAEGVAWAADFSAEEAEARSGHLGSSQPQAMQDEPDEDRLRRKQAGAQAGEGAPQGFGYGAEDGEEMGEAPDASERGYGGAGERRIEKIERDR